MKKTLTILLALLILISLGACAKQEQEEEVADEPEKGEYTIYNNTGSKVTELYVYPVDSSDKGDNYAGEGIKEFGSVVVDKGEILKSEAPVYCLEFTYGDVTQKFETLHQEVASIELKSSDAAAGATAIAFAEPEFTGTYVVTNKTGNVVNELYIYPEGSSDKGENYATINGLDDGSTVTIAKTANASEVSSIVYIVEYLPNDEEARTFDTLHFENASFDLRSASDIDAGATTITFSY